jgi:diguanylate cyclase (GGDEF)-like protein
MQITEDCDLLLANPAPAPEVWEGVSALVAAVLDDPRTGLLVFDRQLRVVHVTSRISPLLGLPEELPLGGAGSAPLNLHRLLSVSALDSRSLAAAELLLTRLPADTSPEPLLLCHRSGIREISMRLRSVGAEYRVATFEDTGGVGLNKERAAEYCLRDLVTGLASRRYFENAVAGILAGNPEEPLAVLFLDLDRFKAVNDSLGHAAGDTVLRLAAERLHSAVRKSDIVARLGGDEFAVLLHPLPTPAETTAIAKRILDLLQRTYLLNGQLVNVGTSIGIAVAPADGSKFEGLLKCADLALYQSKTSGGARFCFFDSEMEKRAQARRNGELDLRQALALRQFEVHYQPQVNIATGHLVGFEALVRWRHPTRGLISPADFLPLAEEIGVIDAMGEWVLRTACREAMKWPADLVIAVNASPSQFHSGRFVESARRALAASGLPGNRLEIEIKEGIFLKNEDTVVATLHALRAMDIRIAMDDFGTGFASLSQLARFPFDKVKIDKSLAGSAGGSPKHRAIVRAVSGLTASLGMICIAEGIETVEQRARLEEDGCALVQGFLFGKPVPTADLGELIARLWSPPQMNTSGEDKTIL